MLKPLSFVLMVTIATPGAAQNPLQTAPTAAPAASGATTKANDPNRIICERQQEIGSRLGGKKVCKTAQEWQIERSQQRETLEKFQQQATGTPVSG